MADKDSQWDRNWLDESTHQNDGTEPTATPSRRQLLHLFGAGGVIGLAGCFAGNEASEEAETATDTGTGTGTGTETGKELQESATIAISMDITGDFYDIWGGVSPYYTRINEPLVWPTPDLKIKPWLATDWSATDENTWVFKLREDVMFHNGEVMNADAVIFSISEFIKEEPYVGTNMLKLKPEGLKRLMM